MRKMKSVQRGISRNFFHILRPLFFRLLHFTTFRARVDICRKVKRFCVLFFHGINETRNSHEIRKVYSECFVFRGVYRENIRKILVKCEI